MRADGGGLFLEESEVKAHWAGYFEQLYQVDPPAVELDFMGVTDPFVDPSIPCESFGLWKHRLQ